MNKGDLIDTIADSTGLSKADTGKALTAALDAITAELSESGSVSLVGFGTFGVRSRAARMGRNPQSGQPMQIRASNSPYFKAGKALKNAVN